MRFAYNRARARGSSVHDWRSCARLRTAPAGIRTLYLTTASCTLFLSQLGSRERRPSARNYCENGGAIIENTPWKTHRASLVRAISLRAELSTDDDDGMYILGDAIRMCVCVCVHTERGMNKISSLRENVPSPPGEISRAIVSRESARYVSYCAETASRTHLDRGFPRDTRSMEKQTRRKLPDE